MLGFAQHTDGVWGSAPFVLYLCASINWGGNNMANILPVTELKNYNHVLKNCQEGTPVFLTKNGHGRFVIMDIADYERDIAEKKLLMKINEAENAVKNDGDWLSLDELKAKMGDA
jgi:prevent-host-death family protein